jgi:hypothetical protein
MFDQFVIDPTVGDAIVKQLSEVQMQAGDRMRHGWTPGGLELGGGYAEQVGAYVQGRGSEATETLTAFRRELEKLKSVIVTSMEKYQAVDASSAAGFSNADGRS